MQAKELEKNFQKELSRWHEYEDKIVNYSQTFSKYLSHNRKEK